MPIKVMYIHSVVRGNDGIYIISGDGKKKEDIRYVMFSIVVIMVIL